MHLKKALSQKSSHKSDSGARVKTLRDFNDYIADVVTLGEYGILVLEDRRSLELVNIEDMRSMVSMIRQMTNGRKVRITEDQMKNLWNNAQRAKRND